MKNKCKCIYIGDEKQKHFEYKINYKEKPVII